MKLLGALLVGLVIALGMGLLKMPADLPVWLPVMEFLALFILTSCLLWLLRKFGLLSTAINPFVLMLMCLTLILVIQVTAQP